MGLTEEELMETMQGAIPKDYDEEAERKRRERIAMERGEQIQCDDSPNGNDPVHMLEQILIGVQAIYNIAKENADRDKRIETKLTAFINREEKPRTVRSNFFAPKSIVNFKPPRRGELEVGDVLDTPQGPIVKRKQEVSQDFEWK